MARQPLAAGLHAAQDNKDLLIDPDRRDILRFRLVRRAEMGQNRKDGGRSPGFIESITAAIDDLYSTVVQQILPWAAKPPQARAATRPSDPVTEPIKDTEDLNEAIGVARATAAVQADVGPSIDDDADGGNLVDAPIRTSEAETSFALSE